MRGYRQIAVDGLTYRYRVGRGGTKVRAPDGVGFVLDNVAITGRSSDTFARGQWKRTTDGMVCPGHIREAIWKYRRGRLPRECLLGRPRSKD